MTAHEARWGLENCVENGSLKALGPITIPPRLPASFPVFHKRVPDAGRFLSDAEEMRRATAGDEPSVRLEGPCAGRIGLGRACCPSRCGTSCWAPTPNRRRPPSRSSLGLSSIRGASMQPRGLASSCSAFLAAPKKPTAASAKRKARHAADCERFAGVKLRRGPGVFTPRPPAFI